jgi:hypothetical protein
VTQAERIGFKTFFKIPGLFDELASIFSFLGFFRERFGNIKEGCFFKVPFNNGFSYQMSNRTDRAETLDAEEIGDSTLSKYFVSCLFEKSLCFFGRILNISYCNNEIISPQVSEFYRLS